MGVLSALLITSLGALGKSLRLSFIIHTMEISVSTS